MTRADTLVSAEAWERLMAELIALGPSPDESKFVRVVAQVVWDTEGFTFDEPIGATR